MIKVMIKEGTKYSAVQTYIEYLGETKKIIRYGGIKNSYYDLMDIAKYANSKLLKNIDFSIPSILLHAIEYNTIDIRTDANRNWLLELAYNISQNVSVRYQDYSHYIRDLVRYLKGSKGFTVSYKDDLLRFIQNNEDIQSLMNISRTAKYIECDSFGSIRLDSFFVSSKLNHLHIQDGCVDMINNDIDNECWRKLRTTLNQLQVRKFVIYSNDVNLRDIIPKGYGFTPVIVKEYGRMKKGVHKYKKKTYYQYYHKYNKSGGVHVHGVYRCSSCNTLYRYSIQNEDHVLKQHNGYDICKLCMNQNEEEVC